MPLDADARDRLGGPRGTGERVGLLVTSTSFGYRVGGMLSRAAGLDAPEHDGAHRYVSAAMALAVPTAVFFLEGAHPLPRGRTFAMITGGVYGSFLSTTLLMRYRGESSPSEATLTGWHSFVGTLAGFGTGYLIGALTNNRAGTGLYTSTLTVSGILTGALLCGITQCGVELGTFVAVGATVGLGGALAFRAALQPTLREMRYVALGGVLGALPALGVAAAYYAREGALDADARSRASAFALGGMLLGGLSMWRLAVMTAPPQRRDISATTPSGGLNIIPSVELGANRVGLSLTVM